MRVRSVCDPVGLRAGVSWAVVAIALLLCNCAHAETRVYLLRGWFGVFSTGMDSMAEELRGKGIKAEAIGTPRLEVDGLEGRQGAGGRHDRPARAGRPLAGREQRDRNGSRAARRTRFRWTC